MLSCLLSLDILSAYNDFMIDIYYPDNITVNRSKIITEAHAFCYLSILPCGY